MTGYCIVKMRSKDRAYRLIRHLNLGGGFGGDTPLFFVDPLLRKLNSTAEVC
jgi:transcription antitermination factor NusG